MHFTTNEYNIIKDFDKEPIFKMRVRVTRCTFNLPLSLHSNAILILYKRGH